jgi:AraC family transcriptional regulator, regulatory protein of adaptative response / methylated-DNA-[protein]-cysteine methyltransferase
MDQFENLHLHLKQNELLYTDKSSILVKDKATIYLTHLSTPLGPMFACATDQGICLLEFSDQAKAEEHMKELCKKMNAVMVAEENDHLKQLKKELQEYFESKRKAFTVPLHFQGTDFQQEVWKALMEIPFGETRSYKQQAESMNKLSAIRAVAAANGQNRIAIVIPCHRVIGGDGKLTGYAGGLHRKKWLLEFENKSVEKAVQTALNF